MKALSCQKISFNILCLVKSEVVCCYPCLDRLWLRATMRMVKWWCKVLYSLILGHKDSTGTLPSLSSHNCRGQCVTAWPLVLLHNDVVLITIFTSLILARQVNSKVNLIIYPNWLKRCQSTTSYKLHMSCIFLSSPSQHLEFKVRQVESTISQQCRLQILWLWAVRYKISPILDCRLFGIHLARL